MAELFDFPQVTFVGTQSLQSGDGFHYYNHYDGEDHDDIDLY